MIYIGIDNGLSGAVAIINEQSVEIYDTPAVRVGKGKSKKRDYVPSEMANLLYPYCDESSLPSAKAVIEAVHIMPKISKHAAGMQYRCAALWEMALACWGIPLLEVVRAVRWRNAMHRGVSGSTAREKSIIAATRLFPKADLSRKGKISHDRCEAVLLAEYARRVHTL